MSGRSRAPPDARRGRGHGGCRGRGVTGESPSNRPLRVALISERAPLARLADVDSGGQSVYVAKVAQCLAHAGHRVDVLTRRDDDRLPPSIDLAPRLRVVPVPAGPARTLSREDVLGHVPALAEAAGGRAADAGYDVVHANFFISGLVGLHLRRSLGVPLVMTFHALGLVRHRHDDAGDAFARQRVENERTIVREADRLIAECPQERSDLIRLYGADPARIATVPGGVDTAEFPASRRAARAAIGLSEHEFVVLHVGRMTRRKGVDDVLRATALLPRGGPVRVLLVGGDNREREPAAAPELDRLRALAGELGIADRVRFVGPLQRHQLSLYYAAADVFAAVPWVEPYGITPLEAMAAGRPVVGSDVGGIRFSVDHGVTGFLVPPGNPAALAARLAELRADPTLAAAMGRAGLHRARSRFTWEGVSSRLVEAYRKAGAAAERVSTPHREAPRWAGAHP